MSASVTFESYFDFLGKLGRTLETLTTLAQEQTAAVMSGNLAKVDDCMHKEQAQSLSLRSMDIKRDKMLAELGLTGVPLSGLASHCPEELRLQAKAVVEQLQGQYARYRAAADVSRTTLECNLHEIEKRMSESPVPPASAPRRPPSGGMTDIRT